MSREIKFRIMYKKYPNIWLKDEYTLRDLLEMDGAGFLGDDDIIEQYTGLKDKNGKEIYEGDRIKIEGSNCVYTVKYGRGVWVARFGDEPGDNICLFHYVQRDTVLYAEVVGNVHEPPKDFRPEHLKRMGVTMVKGGEE